MSTHHLLADYNFLSNDSSITFDQKSGNSLAEYADSIVKENTANKVYIILCEGLFFKTTRTGFGGIDLLKWLRIKGVMNHCLMVSFLPFERLVATGNDKFILSSIGVSFYQLGDGWKSVSNYSKAEQENIKAAFRAEVDLVKFRHQYANLWGAERLTLALNPDVPLTTDNLEWEMVKYPNNGATIINFPDLRDKIQRHVNWFQENKPAIILCDDMHKYWKEPLEGLLGKGLVVVTPKPGALQQSLRKMSYKCLLLDLRLNNETESFTNPFRYSGGKVLLNLRKNFTSLPIIMFTASNKAETYRKLTAAGADYLWTKEGFDFSTDLEYSLQNTLSLLEKVREAVTKFETPIHQKIYEVEKEMLLEYDELKFMEPVEKGLLSIYKKIFFDANYFMDINLAKRNILNFHRFVLANKKLQRPKKIVIHDDIVSEIFINSKKLEFKWDGTTRQMIPVPDREMIILCRYLTNLIYSWRLQNLVFTEWLDGLQSQISAEHKKVNSIEELEEIQIEEKITYIDALWGKATEKLNNIINGINDEIVRINANLKSIKASGEIKLHADYTFRLHIPKLLSTESVAIVTNDKNCAFELGHSLPPVSSSIDGDYRNKRHFENNEQRIAPKSAILTTGKSYAHFTNNEFSDMFN